MLWKHYVQDSQRLFKQMEMFTLKDLITVRMSGIHLQRQQTFLNKLLKFKIK